MSTTSVPTGELGKSLAELIPMPSSVAAGGQGLEFTDPPTPRGWRGRMAPHMRAIAAVLEGAAKANGMAITTDQAEAIAWMALGRTCETVRAVALQRGGLALATGGLTSTRFWDLARLVVDGYETRLREGQSR